MDKYEYIFNLKVIFDGCEKYETTAYNCVSEIRLNSLKLINDAVDNCKNHIRDKLGLKTKEIIVLGITKVWEL